MTQISNQEREDYISANVHDLTQLAIQNRMSHGAGALYVELDNESDLKNREIKVMYFTAKLLATNKQFEDMYTIITSNKSKECVYLVYNDENGKSLILEKRLTQ